MRNSSNPSRRQFLAFVLIWPFDWIFGRRTVSMAGARFRIHRNGRTNRRYLVIHGNERTAWQVLREYIRTAPGTAYLIENPVRNIRVAGGQIDPNRMFTREGAGRSLARLNRGWSDREIAGAHAELDRGRERLLAHVLAPAGGLTVALHNNSEGYSVKDEIPISDRVHLPSPGSPHEFFLCTDPADFERLARSPYNAVLQQNPKGPDDGSLSRLAARRGARYCNLEVALGKANEQREMLRWLDANLP